MTKLPVRVPTGFRIIAHRGASGYAPENTLAAFRLAARMGAREIELDLQVSQDGELVICHDAELARFGYPGLEVANMTLEELLGLDVGAWFSPYLYGGEQMLTFDALLAEFRDRFTYHVEIKSSSEDLFEALAGILGRHRMCERAIITSLDFETLGRVRGRAPDLRAGWLLRKGTFSAESIGRATNAGFFQICPNAEETSAEIVALAHERLLEVRAHHVTDVSTLMRVIETGCDGLAINWPDWLIHVDPTVMEGRPA